MEDKITEKVYCYDHPSAYNCDIIRSSQDNTQRIIDTLNNHWQYDLQQRYNDARLELSQQKQNATLIAALKPAAAAA